MTTRFSDKQLSEFYAEFQGLKEDVKTQRLKLDEVIKCLTDLTEKSDGVIHLFNDMAAGGRILTFLGKASGILLKIGAFVLALFGINHYFGK